MVNIGRAPERDECHMQARYAGEEATSYRERAKRLRAMAELDDEPGTAASLRKVAEEYERKADEMMMVRRYRPHSN